MDDEKKEKNVSEFVSEFGSRNIFFHHSWDSWVSETTKPSIQGIQIHIYSYKRDLLYIISSFSECGAVAAFPAEFESGLIVTGSGANTPKNRIRIDIVIAAHLLFNVSQRIFKLSSLVAHFKMEYGPDPTFFLNRIRI